MTYHSLHQAIISDSINEKRNAIRALKGRESQTASRLLILAAQDESLQIVLASVLAMSAAPSGLQNRYRATYEKLMDHENAKIRYYCVSKLAQFSDPNFFEIFRKASHSADEFESLAACKGLIQIGKIDEVRTRLPNKSDNFVFRIITEIAEKNALCTTDLSELKRLQDGGYKPRLNVRDDPVEERGGRNDTLSVANLIELAQIQVDESLRRVAFNDAVAAADKLAPGIGLHLRNLDGSNRQVLRAQRHILNHGVQSLDVLLCAAVHPAPCVRARSMLLLAELKDPRASHAALKMLDDSDSFPRIAAIEAVKGLGLAQALPKLIEMACTTERSTDAFSTAYIALEAISALGVDLREALMTVYRKGNVDVSPLAVEHLASLKNPTLITELERIIWDENETSAVNAISGIGAIGSQRCLDIIKLRLDDERINVRDRARYWLYRERGNGVINHDDVNE